MNLTVLDWGIVVIVFAFIITVVISSKKLMRSVSDFLAAGRTGGRYLISLSQGTAALGAITIVGKSIKGNILPMVKGRAFAAEADRRRPGRRGQARMPYMC